MLEHRQRRLDEDGGDRADHDDHERGGRQQCVDARALEHGAHQHRDQREDESDGGQDVHVQPPNFVSNASMSSWSASELAAPCTPGTAGPTPRDRSATVAGTARSGRIVSSPFDSRTSWPSMVSSSPTSAMTPRMIWPV